jgi:hypothetical protein
VLVILVVGGIVTWPYWSPTVAPFVQDYLPARPQDEQIATLEDRIAELERTVQQTALRQEDVTALQQDAQALREQMSALIARLQDVEPGVTAVVPEWIDERLNELRSEGRQLGQGVARLDERISDFEEAVTGLDEKVTGLDDNVSGLDEQIAGVEEQVTRQEEQVRTLAQQLDATRDVTQDAAAVALGLSRLSETIGTSRAYRAELDAFKNVADEAMLDDESLQPLEAYAETGVPTFADLYRRFPEMADAVVRAGVEGNDDGVLETTFNRLRSLVTIRRTGEAAIEAGGVDAVLEMARIRMDGGDLPGAIDAVEQLEGASAEAAAWWLDAARSRLAVQRAMERIQIRAIAMLSSREGSSR